MTGTYKLDDQGGTLPVAVAETDLPGIPLLKKGKVRDVYDLGDRLMMVATDRISAFDSVLGSPIPDKGRILTQMSLFWFDLLGSVVPNHLLDTSLDAFDLPDPVKRHLTGRTMITQKAEALTVECVVRGYIIGSGWKEYQKSGTVCGIQLPSGLEMAAKLEKPLFTPSTKAESGHDENISFEECVKILGQELADKVSTISIELYTRAADHARERGIIIADTKFEFGLVGDNELILIDEVLTPDSSRFWPADAYQTGISPPSFDKQFVRDWLERESGWDKEPPAPPLPDHVVQRTREKYLEAYQCLTGKSLPPS